MSDPVLAFVLFAAFFIALPMVHWFKTLDGGLWRDARTPLIAGLAVGIIIRLADGGPLTRIVLIGVLLTIAALYVRLTGRESEPADGMMLGALTGAAAAIPLVFHRADADLLPFAECVLAGAVTGFGITYGLSRVTDRVRQLAIDVVTAGVAIGAAWAPAALLRTGLTDRRIATGAAIAIPLLVIAALFEQWPAVRAELRDEAAHGVIDDEDIRPTAHPFLRLGRAGWHDAGAHREFVRIATKIALRKRQQRNRRGDVARLYQVEIIKLRMQLQEMTRIDFGMRAAAARAQQESS